MALSCVTPRTRVILPVHLFGHQAVVSAKRLGQAGEEIRNRRERDRNPLKRDPRVSKISDCEPFRAVVP